MLAILILALLASAVAVDVSAGWDAIPTYSHGFPYPIDGWSHVAAMVALGMISLRYRGCWQWMLPALFVLMLSLGTALGIAGRSFSDDQAELVTLFSAATLGVLAVTGWRLWLPVLVPLVALFAVFHGYAHGVNIPPQLNAVRHTREVVTAAALLIVMGQTAAILLRLSGTLWKRFTTARTPAANGLADSREAAL